MTSWICWRCCRGSSTHAVLGAEPLGGEPLELAEELEDGHEHHCIVAGKGCCGCLRCEDVGEHDGQRRVTMASNALKRPPASPARPSAPATAAVAAAGR